MSGPTSEQSEGAEAKPQNTAVSDVDKDTLSDRHCRGKITKAGRIKRVGTQVDKASKIQPRRK